MPQVITVYGLTQTFRSFCTAAMLVLVCVGVLSISGHAQEPMRLNTAIELALKNYPTIRERQAEVEVAREEIELTRTAYRPRVDLIGQANRATINNITGLVLPQGVIPTLTGRPVDSASISTSWGSATGALLSWEPFDFGRRRAATDVARAGAKRVEAEVEVTRLDVATAAADAFLATVAAEQVVRVAQSNVERQQTFANAVRVLVQNGLRPGSDASRADANLSDAKIQLLQAQQTVEVRRAQLAERLGVAGTDVTINTGALLEQPPSIESPVVANLEEHPQALAQKLQIETIEARGRLLDRSYFPRFNYQAAISARGTGVRNDGRFEGGFNGILPITPNIATGLSVTFPVFDIFELRSRRRIERSNALAEQARLDRVTQELKSQEAQARALIESTRRIAAEAPVKLTASQQADAAAQAQYKFGLATITEVADAQRLLAQSEIDVAVARLNMWRALLAAAQARGAIEPFLRQVTNLQQSTNPQAPTIQSSTPEK
ncbi:MAG: TolC family protein [Pyrinomonadaceae bacterium]|nr:TolC family protein [Pyrinomonadaceae bacterium]